MRSHFHEVRKSIVKFIKAINKNADDIFLRAKLQKRSLIRVMLMGFLILFGGALFYSFSRISFLSGWTGWKDKTLWDWMDLFVVPLGLALVAYFFNRAEGRTNRELATEQQQERQLQDYFDRMATLLFEKQLHESKDPTDHSRTVARAFTLSVLQRSDALRRTEILRFLHAAKLIQQENRIIDLEGADLSGVSLEKANLQEADLSGATMKKCNLQSAVLAHINLSNAVLDEANLDGANLNSAVLSGASFNGARLSKAKLQKATLDGTTFYRTVLDDADMQNVTGSCFILDSCSLRRTDFRGAKVSEVVTITNCDLRGARFQQTVWPFSWKMEKCRWEGANYNSATQWPAYWDPPSGMIDTDKILREKATQLREKERRGKLPGH